MRIIDLELEHFGKFEEQTMTFQPGINIIYGGNETGKTTMHAFIRAMFFGIERSRGGRVGEYEIRRPWKNGAYFAGKMRVEYGQKIYRIERGFYHGDRELRVICETDGQETDRQGEQLRRFLEGMDEAAFSNTVFIPQAGAQTDERLAEELRDFLLNMRESGDAAIDVPAALERLKKQKREVSEKKQQEKQLLEEKIARKELELEYASKELERAKRPEEAEVSGMPEQPRETATSDVPERPGETATSDVPERPGEAVTPDVPERSGEAEAPDVPKRPGKTTVPGASKRPEKAARGELTLPGFLRIVQALSALIAFLALACCFVSKEPVMRVMMGALCGLFLIMLYFVTGYRKLHADERQDGSTAMPGDAQPRDDTAKEPEASEGRLTEALSRELARQQRMLWRRETEKKIRSGRIREQNIREELEELRMQADALSRYDREMDALDLAMVRIRELSGRIYQEAGRDFGEDASRILSELTEGRYTAISLDERMEVRVNTPERLLRLSQVSFGTMHQIYFALRMAAARLLGGEQLPLVLDEPFAMYDDDRLEAALRWMLDSGRQVILFTCQTREKTILDRIRN